MLYAADQIQARYFDYVSDFRVLVEAQLATAERFDIDYVSCISDPAREAADCGAKIHFFDDQPAAIDESTTLLADKRVLAELQIPDPLGGGRMTDRIQAAALLKERTGRDRIVEGWIEGPCAEAADLRGINALMLDFVDDPSFVRDLFEFVLAMELRFARAQVDAGVDLIGVGDAAASLVGPAIYEELVWPYEKRLVDALHSLGTRVRLHICGDIRAILASVGRLGCDIVDLDSMVPLGQARNVMGGQQVLLGNLDPVRLLLNGTTEEIRRSLVECFHEARCNYIVGAGCEVPRGTPAENLMAMREFAGAYPGRTVSGFGPSFS